jgi:IMP dehydrogenase
MNFTNAHGIPYTPKKFLTFDDVLLVPNKTDIESRYSSEISTKAKVTKLVDLSIPIISANMDSITGPEMAIEMDRLGGMGILHRFQPSYEDWQSDIKQILDKVRVPAFSIGLANDSRKMVEFVAKERGGLFVVCIDVAHGHHTKVMNLIQNIRQSYPGAEIIAGNVATSHGAADLIQAGASAIKVGVGSGSACTTRQVTGFGMPQLTAILKAVDAVNFTQTNVRVIADGGIRNSGDIVKALAAGADCVMLGGLLAGTDETPGEIDAKRYRGQASREFMSDYGRERTPEGESWPVESRGPVEAVLEDLVGGLRSGMSYCGASTVYELSNKAVFIEITENGRIEGTAHGKP